MKRQTTYLVFITFLVTLSSGCQKANIANRRTLEDLYSRFENGSIDECIFINETVFVGGINAYDAPATIFNKDGEVIGNCNFALNQVDPICKQLTKCETIYRGKNSITGQPAVNKYKLK